jgi:hypothetical protein
MELLIGWPNSITMFSIFILNVGNGGNGAKGHAKGMCLGHHFL